MYRDRDRDIVGAKITGTVVEHEENGDCSRPYRKRAVWNWTLSLKRGTDTDVMSIADFCFEREHVDILANLWVGRMSHIFVFTADFAIDS